jgi:hypothetical protein
MIACYERGNKLESLFYGVVGDGEFGLGIDEVIKLVTAVGAVTGDAHDI